MFIKLLTIVFIVLLTATSFMATTSFFTAHTHELVVKPQVKKYKIPKPYMDGCEDSFSYNDPEHGTLYFGCV